MNILLPNNIFLPNLPEFGSENCQLATLIESNLMTLVASQTL